MLRRMLRTDFRRAFGWTFALAVALTVLVQAQGLGEYLVWLIKGWQDGNSSFSYLHFSFDTGTFQLFMPSVGALVYSAAYLRDRQSGFLGSQLTRTGRARSYLLSKAVCTYLATLLAVMLGVLVFFGLLRLRTPLRALDYPEDDAAFACGGLLEAGKPFLYLLCTALFKAAGAASWALFGLMLSAFTDSAFTVYALPTLARYAANLVMKRLGMRSFTFIEHGVKKYGSVGRDFAYTMGPLLAFALAWTLIFVLKGERQVRA